MKERTDTNTTGRKLKKLLIVAMLVCYVPLTSGCVQYVMLAMMVVQGVSGMVAQQREDKGRREAWQKGEPYVRDAATSNWGTASSLAGLAGAATSYGTQTGMWGQETGTTAGGTATSGTAGNSVGGGGQVVNGNKNVDLRGAQSGASVANIKNAATVVTYAGQTAGTNTQTNTSTTMTPSEKEGRAATANYLASIKTDKKNTTVATVPPAPYTASELSGRAHTNKNNSAATAIAGTNTGNVVDTPAEQPGLIARGWNTVTGWFSEDKK